MLRNGDEGEAVGIYQTALMRWDSDALPVYGADKDFGGETETWVRKFQTAHDLPSTGAIGDVTASLLSKKDHGLPASAEREVKAFIKAHAANPDAHHE